MEMKKILILDDKNHAKKQIYYCMTRIQKEYFELIHVHSLTNLVTYQDISFYIAFIDFFLNNDRQCGIKALDKINSLYVVGFSSIMSGSEAISEQAIKMKKWKNERIFAIRKIKNEFDNNKLQYFFKYVIGEELL